LLPVLATAVVALSGCEQGQSGTSPLPSPTSTRTPTSLSNGQRIFYPNSARVSMGVAYAFRLYTHCGLDLPEGVDFDSSFWDPVGTASDGNSNPPPGFGNPFDTGTMTLISTNVAEYHGHSGIVFRFTRHPSRSVVGFPCW
jgi:hypothetical protein